MLNISRLIIAVGAIGYSFGVLVAWWAEGAVDRTPILYVNLAYAFALGVGSYTSTFVQRKIGLLMIVAIYSIQGHALYLVWENSLSASLVGACSTIVLSPIPTLGYAFKTIRQVIPFLLGTSLVVLWIGLSVETPVMNPASFIVTYTALACVCLLAVLGQIGVQQALQKNSMRQRALIDAIPDAMLRLSANGDVLDSSIDPLTSVGQVIACDARNLTAVVDKILAKDSTEKFEIDLIAPDGTTASVEVRSVSSGKNEVTAILRDVTSEKTMMDRLIVANRMAAVGTLSVGIGHEINNPLTYVEGNLQYALDLVREASRDPERDAMIVEALRDAAEGADRVKQIVNDLKRSVRSKAPEGETADASAALAFAVRMAGNQLRNIATVDVDIVKGIRVCGADGKLGQVFLNLLVNAGQALEGGESQENRVSVRAFIQGEHAVFQVEDTGSGISAEIRNRIFDPFFTTKDVGTGTGLGLSICHQIISDLGGELTLQSEPNKGTTATVKLRHVPSTEPAKKARPVASGGELQVLVIDDEPGILRACERMLRKHQVTTCDDSSLALQLILEEDFDVIVCDLMMPTVTGMDIFHSLEEQSVVAAERIIFISGGAVRPDAEEFISAHQDQFLPKPFNRDGLLGALDRTRRRLQS